jgi:predicted dithiol-disulfide oxidoreductase (DUF899 family)
MLSAVSRAPLAQLQAYKRRMGWTFPGASSFGSDFNFDFNVSITAEQQREEAFEYNYQRSRQRLDVKPEAGSERLSWKASGLNSWGRVAHKAHRLWEHAKYPACGLVDNAPLLVSQVYL